jgi:hypothetical protein
MEILLYVVVYMCRSQSNVLNVIPTQPYLNPKTNPYTTYLDQAVRIHTNPSPRPAREEIKTNKI